MKKISRLLTGLLFVAALAVIGFVIGIYIGGNCCVPDDSGLAGGAIVIGYGILGGVVTALLAILVAKALPPNQLVAATLVLGVIGGVFGGVILKVYLDSRKEMLEHRQAAWANMLKFRVALVAKPDGVPQPFKSIAFDWGQKHFKVSIKGRRCVIDLQPEDAATMLGALREVEGIVYRDPFPCADTAGAQRQVLDMYIPEATGEISKAKIVITSACLERYPALGTPMKVAADIFKHSEIPAECQ